VKELMIDDWRLMIERTPTRTPNMAARSRTPAPPRSSIINHQSSIVVALCVGALLAVVGPAAAFDEVIDSPMYHNPELPVPPTEAVFPEGITELWLKALKRPEADMKCKAADAVALAHRRGMKGLESAVAPLVEALDAADQHPAVRLAAARALVTLGAKDAAPSLLKQARDGSGELRDVVEPALARWDYQPARAVWRDRLKDPATPPRALALAVRSLGAVRDEESADRLRELALAERTPGPARLEAARALAAIRADGLEKDAERLAADTSPRGIPSRLAAASLLKRHRGEETVRLLQRLSKDSEPAVVAIAAARLVEIDPDAAVAEAERLLGSTDAKVRGLAVEALFRRPSEKRVAALAERLDDAHPDVRVRARRALRELAATKELRTAVLDGGTRMLATRRWRGLEQAAILLTELDHKPAAKRLVELLKFDRPEVFVTAAWGLRRLAVADTLPGVLRYVEAGQERLRASATRTDEGAEMVNHQLAQLNQFLGEQKYRPADAALRAFIPRMEHQWQSWIGSEARAAAIWALGLIHEGKADAELAAALEARLNDVMTQPPEEPRVRRMCAVTLGRLGAKDALPSLRGGFADRAPSLDPVNNACGWAVERLTGEAVPKPKPIRKMQQDWFLMPSP
jgi:HEAT repeat protein